jgi:hypothetical protein
MLDRIEIQQYSVVPLDLSRATQYGLPDVTRIEFMATQRGSVQLPSAVFTLDPGVVLLVQDGGRTLKIRPGASVSHAEWRAENPLWG